MESVTQIEPGSIAVNRIFLVCFGDLVRMGLLPKYPLALDNTAEARLYGFAQFIRQVFDSADYRA